MSFGGRAQSQSLPIFLPAICESTFETFHVGVRLNFDHPYVRATGTTFANYSLVYLVFPKANILHELPGQLSFINDARAGQMPKIGNELTRPYHAKRLDPYVEKPEFFCVIHLMQSGKGVFSQELRKDF